MAELAQPNAQRLQYPALGHPTRRSPLAHRRGMELDLPLVSEMPAALLEDKPLDAEKWKLPGQAVLDAALGLQGMELLAKWTQFKK